MTKGDTHSPQVPLLYYTRDFVSRLGMLSILFSGRWRTAFRPEATSLQNFWVDDKTNVPVPLMSRVGNFMYVDDKATKSTVVKMPLKKKVYILTVLPHKGTSLDHVEDQLSTKVLSRWQQQFKEG